jgi:hypothetical protein
MAMSQTDNMNKPGERLATVIVLNIFAGLEVLGGLLLFFTASKSSVSFGSDFSPTVSSEHDWVLGAVYLAAAIFFACLLAGFAHLVQDTHDIKRQGWMASRPATPGVPVPPASG